MPKDPKRFLIWVLPVLSLTACSGPKVDNQQLLSPEKEQDTTINQDLSRQELKSTSSENYSLSATSATESSIMPDQNITTATIKTSKGDITFEFFPEAAPQTVANFIDKSKSSFYEGLNFHRVEDWVIQGGDPLGNGTGGGKMPTELSEVPFKKGSVGVARGGDIKVSNDAQFFICKNDCGFLTGQYTIFGQVKSGMDVVNQIEIGDEILAVEVE